LQRKNCYSIGNVTYKRVSSNRRLTKYELKFGPNSIEV
jgi:hypothetical protein